MRKIVLDGVAYMSGKSWVFEGTNDQGKDRYFDIGDLVENNIYSLEHGAKIRITLEEME